MRTNRAPAMLMVAPALLVLAALTLYPLGRGLALSFFSTDYGFEGARFVGARNYAQLASDRFFRTATLNTVWFTIVATFAEIVAGLGLALLVNRPFRGRSLVIVLLVTPYLLSTMVVTSIWSAWFHYDHGYLNNVLGALGLERVPWLSSPATALYAIALVDVWQTCPFVFLILLAGLQSIDREIYEAARMDGAGRLHTLLTITIPLLAPHILLAGLVRSIDSFKLFDKVYALTGGGPGHATETLSMYLYRVGFKFSEIGMASAVAIVMVLVAAVLACVYAARIMRRPHDA